MSPRTTSRCDRLKTRHERLRTRQRTMITELTMVNVKGTPKRELSLGPVTLVQGPNYTGKTAVAQAIRIGLLGYDPTLGKLASATYGLASGEKMEVSLALSGGATACRTWEMKRGKLVTGGDRDALTEPMMMDIDQYFSLTKQARIDYVMSMAADGGITNCDVMGALSDAAQKVAAEWTEDHAGQHAEISQQTIELLQGMEQEGATQTDVVDTLLIDWAERAKKTKAVIAQMAGATQAGDQLAEEGPTYRDQTRAIGEKQAAIDLLSKSYGVMAERAAKRRKLELTLVAEINAEQVGANEGHIAQVRTDLGHRKSDLESSRKILGETTAEKLQASVNVANDELKAVNKRKLEYEQELWTINRQIESGAATLKDLADQDAVANCKHCGSAREHWKQSRDLKKEIQENIRQARVLMDKRDALQAILKESIPALQSVAEDAVKTMSVALSDWYNLRDYANEQAQIIGKQERDLATALGAGDRVAAARAALDADGSETAEVLTQKVNEIQVSIELAQGELRALQAQQNQYARQCERKLTAERAAAERKKQEARLQVLADALDEMKLVKERAANKQWGTFLKTINEFTADLLKFRVEFEDGEMGYRDGKRWVSHETFSGIEQQLVYIGLGVALAAKSKIKIVVMDEMGILDAMHEWKVIERMKALVEAGTISQFVGMTSRKIDDIDGVQMIRL